jgi:hypothetical protein
MTTTHHIIAYSVLSITIAVLLAVILCPTEQEPLPIDPQKYILEERRRLRALEVYPLECENDSLVKELKAQPKQRASKRTKVANERMNMADSLHKVLLHERIK